jgi:hypothetical protein
MPSANPAHVYVAAVGFLSLMVLLYFTSFSLLLPLTVTFIEEPVKELHYLEALTDAAFVNLPSIVPPDRPVPCQRHMCNIMSAVPAAFSMLLLSSVRGFSDTDVSIFWAHLREIKVNVSMELSNVSVSGCRRLGEVTPPVFSFYKRIIFRFVVLSDLLAAELVNFNITSLGHLDCGHLSICIGMCEIHADAKLYLTLRQSWKFKDADADTTASSSAFWSRFFSSDVAAFAYLKLRSSKFSASFIDGIEQRVATLDESIQNRHICYVVRGYSAHLLQIHDFKMSLMSHARGSGSFVDVFFASTDSQFDGNGNLYDEYKHTIDGINNVLIGFNSSVSARIHVFPSTAWRCNIYNRTTSERHDSGYRQFDVTDYALSTISRIARAFKSHRFCEYIYLSNSDNIIRQSLHGVLSAALEMNPKISLMFFKTAWKWAVVSGVEAWIGNWVARRDVFEKLSFIEAYINFCHRTQTRCGAYMADGSLLYSFLPAKYSPVSCSKLDTCHLTLHDEELLVFDALDNTARWYAALN